MNAADRSPWNHLALWLRVAFGVHLAYSGLAYVIDGWVPVDLAQAHAGPGAFMVALDKIGLYPIVKYLELLFGAMLIFDIAVPLALVMELPFTIVIAYLNLFVADQARHHYTGVQELFLNVSLMLLYGGHYVGFLKWKARPWWLWDGLRAPSSAQPARVPSGATTGADA